MQAWSQATLYRQTIVLDVVIDEERLKRVAGHYDRYLQDAVMEVQRNDRRTHVVLEASSPETLESWSVQMAQIERDLQQAEHLAWLQNVLSRQCDEVDMSLYNQLKALQHQVDCLENAYRKHMLNDGLVPQDTPREDENPF